MFRIIKEENKLSGKVQYIIERRRNLLWMKSWSRDLGLDVYQNGPIGALTSDGAKRKLEEIISSDGVMVNREVFLES
tara:strand:+ start:99 stop:329 length:231 start_codon:yes stop_codon:yes gene_type:complete